MLMTERLIIKPYSNTEQESMIELLTNETIKKTFMIPDFKNKEEAVGMFQKLLEYSVSSSHYERGIFKGQELIGFVNDVEIEGDTIELGYVIHPKYHNQGYATEMLTAVIEDLFQKGFHEVLTGAFDDNIASQRVMEKSGMKRIDKTEDITYHGELHHCVYYSKKA